ncbi:hypothetical protein ACFYSW_25160 [Rhodococcus aetherivorans]|uniref:hypothetical protein n=1 Tax=Rhodococcus aetherivorans TaxID=191292 RepID=UPI0036BC1141
MIASRFEFAGHRRMTAAHLITRVHQEVSTNLAGRTRQRRERTFPILHQPLRTSTIAINGAVQDFPPQIPATELEILTRLGFGSGH